MTVAMICSDAWWDSYSFKNVAMKIALADNLPSVQQLDGWVGDEFEVTRDGGDDVDIVICWGVTQMNRAKIVRAQSPNAKLINFNWDIYEWAVKSPRENEYDYEEYVRFILSGDEMWVPSNVVGERTAQWFEEWHGVTDFPTYKILSHAPTYDVEISDDDFVFNTQRKNPDERLGWFPKACEELGIPYKESLHQMEQDEYRKTMGRCTFQVSHYYEMSTGGLGILEGYYLGKPVLLSNSKWQGGGEYMGDRAVYFQHDDFDDFKEKLSDMWENREKYKVDLDDARAWLKENYSEEALAERIKNRLRAIREETN